MNKTYRKNHQQTITVRERRAQEEKGEEIWEPIKPPANLSWEAKQMFYKLRSQ